MAQEPDNATRGNTSFGKKLLLLFGTLVVLLPSSFRREESLREDDVGSPRSVSGLACRAPPESSLLGDEEAVAGVASLLLVVEQALEGPCEKIAK